MTAYDTKTIERNGKMYRVDFHPDEGHYTPWDDEDGHGPVSEWETRNKAPGERVLCEDRRAKRFYGVQGAMQKALAEGWDAPPYGAGTKRQQAARAVEADFKRLRAWCNDEWQYIGIAVTERRTDADGYEYDGPRASLWGIESDSDADYIEQIINELIDETTPA